MFVAKMSKAKVLTVKIPRTIELGDGGTKIKP